MGLGSKVVAAAFVAGAWFFASVNGRADDVGDPTFGRISGDVSVVAGAGGLVASHAFRAEGELRARYLDTVGFFATYEETLAGEAGAPQRAATGGLEIRPLFLYRWLTDQETGKARLDLAVDSCGLEMGAVIQPSAPSGAAAWGVLVGFGFEVPLEPDETGPWIALHAGVRWSDTALTVGSGRAPEDRTVYLAVTVAWHQVLATHVVDVGDRPPR